MSPDPYVRGRFEVLAAPAGAFLAMISLTACDSGSADEALARCQDAYRATQEAYEAVSMEVARLTEALTSSQEPEPPPPPSPTTTLQDSILSSLTERSPSLTDPTLARIWGNPGYASARCWPTDVALIQSGFNEYTGTVRYSFVGTFEDGNEDALEFSCSAHVISDGSAFQLQWLREDSTRPVIGVGNCPITNGAMYGLFRAMCWTME